MTEGKVQCHLKVGHQYFIICKVTSLLPETNRVTSYFWKLANKLPIDVTDPPTWSPCVIVRGLTIVRGPNT